jgi:palmitoyltransferase ZDHHC9/14/18/palmitoyltransferase
MSSVKVKQKNSNDTSTSINILNEKEEEEIHNNISTSQNILNVENTEINNKNKKNEIDNEKDDKITLEDLTNIISQPDEQDPENEKDIEQEHNKEEKIKKLEKNSQDDLIKKNIIKNKKQNLSKYLVNPQIKATSNESEEESTHNDIHQIKPSKYKLYKFVGRTLFVFLDKFENPLIIIGPHWPMYICFCGIISLIMLAIYITLWKDIGLVMRIIGIICYWTYFISYSHCSLCNPGYPKNDIGRNFGYPREEYYFCNFCQFYVKNSNYVSHCTDCDICIENQDHHCPWTGHCIGKNNYYSFYIFIASSFCIILYLATAICVGASTYN